MTRYASNTHEALYELKMKWLTKHCELASETTHQVGRLPFLDLPVFTENRRRSSRCRRHDNHWQALRLASLCVSVRWILIERCFQNVSRACFIGLPGQALPQPETSWGSHRRLLLSENLGPSYDSEDLSKLSVPKDEGIVPTRMGSPKQHSRRIFHPP